MNDSDYVNQLLARIAELEEEIGVLHLRLASETRLEHGEEGRIQELEQEVRRLWKRNAQLEARARRLTDG